MKRKGDDHVGNIGEKQIDNLLIDINVGKGGLKHRRPGSKKTKKKKEWAGSAQNSSKVPITRGRGIPLLLLEKKDRK